MASPPPSPKPKSRASRVSPQHTLERVRNNQRRHRARQRDHITALEQKLSEAEQTVATLRDRNQVLEARLTQCSCQNEAGCCRVPPGPQSQGFSFPTPPSDLPNASFRPIGVVSEIPDTQDSDDFFAESRPKLAVETSKQTNGAQLSLGPFAQQFESSIGRRLITNPDTSSPYFSHPDPGPNSINVTTIPRALEGAETLLSASMAPDRLWTLLRSCDPSSPDSQPACNAICQMSTGENSEKQLLLSRGTYQPSSEACCETTGDSESTTLCSEAYFLIAQQNFKGVSPEDVERLLWSGFRRSLGPGEGCRIKTDTLFNLLAYISDV